MRLLFVGDVMLGRLVNRVLRSQAPEYPWGDTLPVFRQADLRICNLECVLSDRGRAWNRTPKKFHFRSDAKNVAVLEAAGIDAVSLANNHTLDYDYDAMLDMLQILGVSGITFAGAGADLQTALQPGFRQADGLRFGLLSFTDNEPEWEAGPGRPGVSFVPASLDDGRAQALLASVRDAGSLVDILTVAAHWGPNLGYEPPASHRPFAHALIDAGADIIFGHSGHVFRGIEIYRGKPVIYCAGNFIDDYAVDENERNDESFIFMVEIGEGARIERLLLHATIIENFQARLARGSRARDIALKMDGLCRDLGTRTSWKEVNGILEIPVIS